jgi:hypothetical protein
MTEQNPSGNAPAPAPGAGSGADKPEKKSERKGVFRAAMRIKTAEATRSPNEEANVKYFEPAGVGGRKKGDVVSGLSTEQMRRLWRSGALVQDDSPDDDSPADEPDFGTEDTGASKSSVSPSSSSDAGPKRQGTATPTK